MTETGLLIAQGVVVLLIYLLVWSIVRSSSRELREASETPFRAAPLPPDPVETVGAVVSTVPVLPTVSPTIDEPAPATVAAAATPTDTASGARRERLGPALDLAANLNPRILVESSPGGLAVGTEIELGSGMSIGRGDQNGLALEDAFVSHMHARIFRRGQYLYLEDLGSTNGTFVNDRRIDKEAQLRVRDEIRIGETVLRYEE